MASTYSPNLRLELITTGEQSGTWGTTTNTNLGTLLEQAIGGYETVAISNGDNTLTTQNGSPDQARNAVLRLSGSLSSATTVNCGLIEKVYVVQNDATGAVTFRANSSDTGVLLPSGARRILYCNGTNVLDSVNDLPSGATVNGLALVSISGTQTLTNKTLTSPVITNGGTLTLPTTTDTLVGRATTDTLTNKTLTSPVISTIVNTGTLTLPTSTDTLVGRDTTDTLTNKTLTAPKFADGGFLADANGNELIVMDTVASSVNEIKVANAATGGSPSIAAQGSDADVSFSLSAKGTGTIRLDSVASLTAGTALLPSLTPTGDPNTGMWFPAADTISFSTNGAEDFRIGSAGQLGIAGANYGTSGQALLSGGASAAPSWGSPAALSTASGSAPSYSARAWVCFNGTGTVAIKASGNVSSVGDRGTGAYSVNFTTNMPDANYAWSGAGRDNDGAGDVTVGQGSGGTKSTSQLQIEVVNAGADNFDSADVNIIVLR